MISKKEQQILEEYINLHYDWKIMLFVGAEDSIRKSLGFKLYFLGVKIGEMKSCIKRELILLKNKLVKVLNKCYTFVVRRGN